MVIRGLNDLQVVSCPVGHRYMNVAIQVKLKCYVRLGIGSVG